MFESKISMGNLITIAMLIVAIIGSYFQAQQRMALAESTLTQHMTEESARRAEVDRRFSELQRTWFLQMQDLKTRIDRIERKLDR
jgi:hypothetical protein